ncbi:MAG: VTC domain-containing protein [Saprospiraceae bacterium]|nr:VTC domain-containing protein [Saprospiraceae bacterium]
MTDWRYERKYRITEVMSQSVVAGLLCHPAGFRRQYSDRQINNIYFDTPELKTFQENLAGISERSKYRLRWYGPRLDRVDNARWEVKSRRNMLGTKSVTPVNGVYTLEDLMAIKRMVNGTFAPEVDLHPKLINTYQRSYFISADRRFRATVDRSLDFLPLSGQPRHTRFNLTDPAVILEVKYAFSDDDRAVHVLDAIPYRQSKSSKYVTGILMSVQT